MNHSWSILKKKIFTSICLFTLLTILSIFSCTENNPVSNENIDILQRLTELEGITVRELQSSGTQKRLFQIDMEQPINHNNPGGPKFTQRLYLHHVDVTKPMLFAPDGYETNQYNEIGGELMTMLQRG